MAEITVATAAVGWVVSPVISLVINKIGTFIENKYFKKSGTEDDIEDDLKQMKTTLLEILATMAVVEKQRIVDPNQVQLVRQIKDAVYDAEDCIHEFDYNLLKEKSEKSQEKEKSEKSQEKEKSEKSQEKEKSKKSQQKEKSEKSQQKEISAKSQQNMVRRAAPWIIPKMCRNAEVKDAIKRSDLPKRTAMCLKTEVKEVIKSLDLAKRSADKLLRLMDTKISSNKKLPEQDMMHLTSSIVSEQIIGREIECDNLIDLLFEKVKGPPTVIPIVGQGGIGKTTLAQMVFKHPRVTTTKHFDKKMWLTVSDNFDMLKLTKEMLKYIHPNFSTENVSFDMVQTKLEEELKTKKILLMLDDVWYVKDDKQKSSYEQGWLRFLAPLKNAKEGSKIIVTTREDLVVRSLASFGSIRPISLEGLNDDDGWSLLKLKAFDGGNPDNLNDLEPIGKMIVSKLKGSALAIRVIGMELRGKSDKGEWERILNGDLLDKGDIMEILLRSYEHLPDHLQRCFAYCSLFPKDYRLKPNRLVHMWIAQGFVHPQDGNISEKENNGRSYFNELIARSFLQVIKRDNKEYYVMHDLMNDLACYVSEGECYRLEEGGTLENLGSIRHLSITIRKELDHHEFDSIPKTTLRELEHLINYICGLDKLRTLIFLSHTGFSLIIEGDFSIKLNRIRVLDIEWRFDKLPVVGECKHLHYLCFRNSLAPDAFSKLYLLTVLFIRRNFRGRAYVELTLPKSISNMSRLEFIENSKSILMKVSGGVQLHSLLRGGSAMFHVDKKKGSELGHLRDFNNIKDALAIHGLENVVSKEEAIKAQLDRKKHVTKLFLFWDSSSIVKSNKHNEILEALKPNPSLERLDIIGYLGEIFPSWLESNWLSRMTYIWIAGWTSGFKTLPALGQLSQLKEVTISHLTTVSRIGDEFYGDGTFSSLEELRIFDIVGLVEWSSPSGVQTFPKLRRLELSYCPDLFSIPEMESFCSLEKMTIINCPKIRSLPKLHVGPRHHRSTS